MQRAAVFILFAGLSASLAAEVTPVEKVITLLEELKTEVEEEGKAEAKTYDTFACFCKDTTKEKSDAILTEQDNIEEFAAKMQEKTEDSAAKAVEIAELEDLIAATTKHIEQITAMREQEKTAYEANAADLGKGVSSLEGAIADAKGGQSLLSLKMSAKRSLIMADALGLASQHHEELTAFLQASEGDTQPEGGDYQNHGAALIAVFEGLDKEFLAKKAAVEQQEAEAKKDFNALLKTKQGELKEAEENKATAEEEKDGFDKELGEFTEKMVSEEATLKDDQLYMKDLTAQCELKAREWDQQSAMRASEVAALTKALEIIQAKVVDNSKVSKRAFLQEAAGPTAKPAQAKDTYLEDSDIGDVLSFVQVSSPRSKLAFLAKAKNVVVPEGDRQQRALSNLAQKSQKLKSAVLMSLVMRAAADPFVKVKKLIQDLIEKLVTEAAEQATKKGWCDTELGKANNDRDSQMATIMETNAVVAGLEATKDSLTEEIATLTAEIAELNDVHVKTTKERTAEKAENTDTLDKAKEGLAAVKDAYDVLASFYKGAGKAKVALLQVKASPVAEDAPDSGAGGAYKGNQAKGGGILAMLEVIISDFERTIKVTTKAEKAAAKEFTKFERATKVSITTKETQKSNDEFDLKNTEMKIVEGMDTLGKTQTMLDDTLKTLEELNPACVDTGMSYEDRVQKRKDEIEALKTAMCQLDAEGVEEGC